MKVTVRPTPRLCLVPLLLLLATGCRSNEARPGLAQNGAVSPTAYAVNYPLAYFAQRLAPEQIGVVFPSPPGVDPAFWKPAPEVIGQFQEAGVILLNGAGYARWVQHATLPKSRVVVTADGCRAAFLPAPTAVAHQHGPDGEHAHGDTAFTTWLDLRLAVCQASHVRDALVRLSPTHEAAINARFDALEGDLVRLDQRLRAGSNTWRDKPVLGSHPVYQYLADAYSLRIEALHFEPDVALTQADLQALDALLEKHPSTIMLWEAQPLAETEKQLSDRGIGVVVFEPVAQAPADDDFLARMTQNVDRLTCATGAESCR
jgi:zinc transport system substrate-binding protein